jgi:hypothetical protein
VGIVVENGCLGFLVEGGEWSGGVGGGGCGGDCGGSDGGREFNGTKGSWRILLLLLRKIKGLWEWDPSKEMVNKKDKNKNKVCILLLFFARVWWSERGFKRENGRSGSGRSRLLAELLVA